MDAESNERSLRSRRLSAFQTSLQDHEDGRDQGDIPPADGGRGAWKFLFGAFIIEALLWGFLLTFGVFEDYYSTHPPLEGNKGIAWIGVLGTGVLFLGSPVMTYVSELFPNRLYLLIWSGWSICIVSLVSASFCSSLGGLAATSGIMYGFGFLVLYYPILKMLNDWFIKRRGLAYGVLFGAAGVSGIVLPFIMEILLAKYGYRTTFRIFAVAICVISGPAILLLRRRDYQNLSVRPVTPETGGKYFEDWRFYLAATSNIFQGFALYLPFIYLPSYATDLGYSSTEGALLLALANAAQVLGQIAAGILSDQMSVHSLMFISSGVSAIAALTAWGCAKSIAPLIVFSFLYGGFAGGFVVLWPRIGTMFGEKDARTVYGFLAFEKGIGNVLSGPISSALLTQSVVSSSYGIGKYKNLVVFVGILMAASAVLGGAGHFTRKARANGVTRRVAGSTDRE